MREHHRSDDPDAIERELEAKRAKVDRTIDQIQERLSPGQLLDEGLNYFRDGSNDYLTTIGSNLGKSVRDNPLPVAMIGLGVAWLALGQGPAAQPGYRPANEGSTSLADRARSAADRIQRAADETDDAFEKRRQQAMSTVLGVRNQVGDTAADFKERVSQAMEEASDRWDELKDDLGRRGSDLHDRAADGIDQARDTAAHASDKALEIFEQQPLLAAAAGITLGALLGSLLPATRQESEALAPYGDAVRRQAKVVGSEAAHAAKEAGRAAADAALGSADRALDEVEQSLENGSSPEPGSSGHNDRLKQSETPRAGQPAQPRPTY